MRSRFIFTLLVFWLAPTLGSAQMKGDPKAGKADTMPTASAVTVPREKVTGSGSGLKSQAAGSHGW